MGAVFERISDIAKRCGDLSPLQEPVRARLWEGNAFNVLAGLTFDNVPVAPLKASTLRRRYENGPPRAPNGSASRAVHFYTITVNAGVGDLRFIAGWPGFPEIEYLHYGNPNMAARPTIGFRPQDLQWIREQMAPYVLNAAPAGAVAGSVTGWRASLSRAASFFSF